MSRGAESLHRPPPIGSVSFQSEPLITDIYLISTRAAATPSPGSTASSAGTASMSFPTTPGVYELRLNRNNGAVRVATSAQITVTTSTTATPTPNVTPTPVATPTPISNRINVALASNGSIASASSQFSSSYSPDLAINGVRNWASGGGGWKDATAGSFPDWLQVDFNGSQTIDEISIFGVPDDFATPVDPTENTTFSLYGLTSFEVQYWNGSNWVTVPNGSITNNNKVWTRLLFSAVTTTAIRVVVNNALTGNSRIVEIEAWGGGANPTTGAASVSASSSTVTAGGTLNVTWSGVTSPTTTDWIGIFPIGAADYGYLSYIYTSSGTPSPGSTASSAGTASMSFPTTPGVYELRLNRNNGAVRVATSAQITVR
ncbi:MAG: discoidin domain-containing protein [Pyrinomonadaceae bacterium]